ncbi:MAG: glycosyltransferase family 4 protein [Alteraurantiacibacter sp.]
MAEPAPWIVCQLGAREHYVLAEGLHRRGQLRALVTDRWAPPGSLSVALPGGLGQRLADRFNPALGDARVLAFTGGSLAREAVARLRGTPRGWPKIMADNVWFEHRAVAALERVGLLVQEPKPVVFAYSYAALGILQAARKAGCTTVLGQIDPAIAEEDIVVQVAVKAGLPAEAANPAPPTYWDRWREECALADHIVVNSAWAQEGLERAGVDRCKIRVVPLAYAAPPPTARPPAPDRFTAARPLRVLFLGSLIARKGIFELLEAARLLAGQHVELHLVGPGGEALHERLSNLPNVTDHGAVARQHVHAHFARADLFVLPTHSDGFALTQLEAQAHGLPVIASRHCGDVVRDGVNGLLLPEVSGVALTAAIARYLADPALLAAHAAQARPAVGAFAPDVVLDQLQVGVLWP